MRRSARSTGSKLGRIAPIIRGGSVQALRTAFILNADDPVLEDDRRSRRDRVGLAAPED
jgi:hypothetical protein